MQHSSGSSGSGNKRVRTACVVCRRRKIRCDGGFPCEQCAKLEYTCEYDDLPMKRSAVQAFDAQALAVQALDRQALVYGPLCVSSSSSSPAPPRRQLLVPALPRELNFNGVGFGSRELHFINTFLRTFHVSVPTIPARMFRDGVNPVNLELLGLPGANDRPKIEAARAVSWAAAAVGASSSDVSLAQSYAAAAVRHLRQCFEVPCEESVMAYIMVGEASYQLGNPDALFRYADFADAMEETMPPMASEHKHALTLHRMRVQSVSNGRKSYDRTLIFPPPEEIERMDFRVKLLFLEHIYTQKVRDMIFDSTITKEDKIRACREAIDVVTPLVEELETNPQYKDCSLSRIALYLPLCYFWAVCGDKAKALHCASRLLDVFEQNLFFMAVPNAIELRIMSSFLGKLGAPELQQRVERLCDEGSKYVIWTPPHSEDIALLQHLEALAEELQAQSESPLGSTSTTENELTESSFAQHRQPFSDFDLSQELGFWADEPDGFDVLGDFRRFTECPSP